MSPSKKSTTFAAFLRGINVGGANNIKMDALRSALEKAGFENVKTILASGNVIFSARATSESALAKKFAECVKDNFGLAIGVIVRSVDDLQKIADSDPFKKIRLGASTKLYVTFLPGKTKSVAIKPPSDAPYRLVRSGDRELFTYMVLSAGVQSTDLMAWLDKNYGKGVTTRSWNTIAKVLKAAGKEKTK